MSIITPAYDCAEFLPGTIESVQCQTFQDWELLVVDDHSTDSTYEIAQQFAEKDGRIRVLRTSENGGAATARNMGIRSAKGRYIAFVDSDDIWLPTKIDEQLAFMQATGVALSYTNYEKISERTGNIIGCVTSPDHVTERDLKRSNQIACSTAMYDAARTGRVFMPSIRMRQDWGLWLTLTKMGFPGRNVGRTLVRYRVRSTSISSNKLVAMQYTWRFFRDVAELPFLERLYRIGAYALINMRKYWGARL